MKRCPDHARIQDHLEGLLEPAERKAWLEHLAGCAACTTETARVRRLFSALVDLPVFEPSPALTGRILSRVLPTSSRHRWLVRFGWGYAAAFAACAVAVAAFAAQPSSRSFLAWLSSEASGRVITALDLVVRGVSFAAVGTASMWAVALNVGARIEPLARAMLLLVSQPAVALALTTAVAGCLLLLRWLKPAVRERGKGIRHVGLLGI